MTEIGLIGAGGMAAVYADRLADLDASVTAVASPSSAPSFVDEHAPAATAYGDAATLCAEAGVDAVAVLTPTDTHAEIVETAVAHDLDVICEKPLARTLAGAERIRRAVEDAGVTFATAHVVRFFPEYATARERIEAGAIGTPGVVRARRAFGYQGDRGWFDDPGRSGGVLLDLAIHDLDYLRWTFGEVEHVFARYVDWGGDEGGHSEVALTLVRFTSGAVGHVEAWWIEVPGVPFTTAFEVAGDEGHIEFDNDVRPLVRYDDEGAHVPRDPVGHDLPLGRDGYARQLEDFLGAVRTGGDPAVGVEEGIASLRVGLAAVESAERGVPVSPAALEVES
jgi:predicted dehydrogenase